MDHDVPDSEDIVCQLGVLETQLAVQGYYQRAAIVESAAARLRLDADEIADLRAQAERAERVAVWAAKNSAYAYAGDNNFLSWLTAPKDSRATNHDGTDADIYRALAEACEGGRDGD